MTKQMDSEYIFIKMALNMKDNGKMTFSTAKVKKAGQMAANTWDHMCLEKNMVTENILGLIKAITRETGKRTKQTEKEYMSGVTEKDMKDSGLKTKCMEMELINGKMEENTLGSIFVERSKDSGNTRGQMVENMQECGVKINDKVTVK